MNNLEHSIERTKNNRNTCFLIGTMCSSAVIVLFLAACKNIESGHTTHAQIQEIVAGINIAAGILNFSTARQYHKLLNSLRQMHKNKQILEQIHQKANFNSKQK
ncbi:MAG: hypothetical protein IKW57_01085 [Alphaproteobacteria bacterium]|nr:hypothetical protein [Alphaproteobacteria bacterium]